MKGSGKAALAAALLGAVVLAAPPVAGMAAKHGHRHHHKPKFVVGPGNLVAPLINKAAIQADYRTANARQLQSVYNYQRVILNAFTEVVNRVSRVQNYSKSIEVKKQQVKSLEASVEAASKLFQAAFPGADYMDVLFAQRDLLEARMVLIETKQQQLAAIVNVYQALGGGLLGCNCADPRLPQPGPSLHQSQ